MNYIDQFRQITVVTYSIITIIIALIFIIALLYFSTKQKSAPFKKNGVKTKATILNIQVLYFPGQKYKTIDFYIEFHDHNDQKIRTSVVFTTESVNTLKQKVNDEITIIYNSNQPSQVVLCE